jgi:hypothetical protein
MNRPEILRRLFEIDERDGFECCHDDEWMVPCWTVVPEDEER